MCCWELLPTAAVRLSPLQLCLPAPLLHTLGFMTPTSIKTNVLFF